MTPFVGREHETALLMERWRDACEGEGQVALLSGEAGIGKSRILASFARADRRRAACDDALPMLAAPRRRRLLSDHEPDPPRRWPASGEPPNAALGKLEAMIARSRPRSRDDRPLSRSASVDSAEGRYAAPDMAPSELKERTVAALIALFAGLARDAPVLALLEDAHWIDPTSLDVFNRIIERLPGLRALLVVTFRPEFAAPWVGRANVATLAAQSAWDVVRPER